MSISADVLPGRYPMQQPCQRHASYSASPARQSLSTCRAYYLCNGCAHPSCLGSTSLRVPRSRPCTGLACTSRHARSRTTSFLGDSVRREDTVHCTVCRAAPSSQAEQTKDKPFVPPGTWPFLGHFFQLDFETFHLSSDELLKKYSQRTINVRLFGRSGVHFRHPDDCLAILDAQADSFAKVPAYGKLHRLIGNGILAQVRQNCILA